MKRNYDLISKKLLQAYEKNLFYLPMSKLGHFFERAYRITGDRKYYNILASYACIAKVSSVKKMSLAIKQGRIEAAAKELLKNEKKPRHTRNKKRREIYLKYPKIFFYNKLLVDLFFAAKVFALHRTVLKNEFDLAVKSFSREEFEKLYTKKEVLAADSSFSINTVFLLSQLSRIDLRKKAVESYSQLYFHSPTIEENSRRINKLSNWEYMSVIYSLTHIIIAQSGFYEKKVVDYDWILDFFAYNFKEIISKTTPDIVAEVGFCFKLCEKQKKYSRVFGRFLEYSLEKLELGKLDDPEYLVSKEHTNSILLMLFADYKKLHKGPDVSRHPIFNK